MKFALVLLIVSPASLFRYEYLHRIVLEIMGIEGLADGEDVFRPVARAEIKLAVAIVDVDLGDVKPLLLVLQYRLHDVRLPEIVELLRAQVEKDEPVWKLDAHEEAQVPVARHPDD